MSVPDTKGADTARSPALRAALVALVALVTVAGGVWIYQARMGTGPPVATDQVRLELNDFRPDAVRIPTGTTVTWHWDGQVTHDLVFDDGETVSPRFTGTYRRTFTSPGTYDYRCTLHGPMRGQVEVGPPSS